MIDWLSRSILKKIPPPQKKRRFFLGVFLLWTKKSDKMIFVCLITSNTEFLKCVEIKKNTYFMFLMLIKKTIRNVFSVHEVFLPIVNWNNYKNHLKQSMNFIYQLIYLSEKWGCEPFYWLQYAVFPALGSCWGGEPDQPLLHARPNLPLLAVHEL